MKLGVQGGGFASFEHVMGWLLFEEPGMMACRKEAGRTTNSSTSTASICLSVAERVAQYPSPLQYAEMAGNGGKLSSSILAPDPMGSYSFNRANQYHLSGGCGCTVDVVTESMGFV